MKYWRHMLLATSAAILAACASTTPYQPASQPGGYDGYSQTMLENDRARVSFGGNSLTNRDTVENYLLFRSAELATERGYTHFTLAERDTEEDRRIRVSAQPSLYDPYFRYSYFRPAYGWSPYYRWSRFHSPFHRSAFDDPFFQDYDVRETTKYRATAEVIFSNGEYGRKDNTFDAREVLNNLGPTIVFPERTS